MTLRQIAFAVFALTCACWYLLLGPRFGRTLLMIEHETYPYASGMPFKAFTVQWNPCCSGALDIRIQPLWFTIDLVISLLVLYLFVIYSERISEKQLPGHTVISFCILFLLCAAGYALITKDDDYHLSLRSPYDTTGLCGADGDPCY